MQLDLRHLRLVKAVAAVGGLTRAGRDLHLTQSALSHQLRDVETRLGTPIFLRVGKRMVLTSAGERLLRTADEVLDTLERTEEAIREFSGDGRGRLRVSAGCYAQYHWLPPVLEAFGSAFPNVDVQIAPEPDPDPVKALLDGRLDLAIVHADVEDVRLTVSPLFDDELVLVVSPGHALALRTHVNAADLAGETILLDLPGDGSPLYRRLLAPAGVKPARLRLVAQSSAAIEIVKAGLGVAVMGRWAVEPLVRGGALRALSLTRHRVLQRWHAVFVKDLARVPYVRAFLTLVGRTRKRASA